MSEEEPPQLSQYTTPLFDAIVNYAQSKKVSFHTPGHKHGDGIDRKFREFVGSKIFDMDLTLLEEVDSLQDPKTVIKEAQRLTSELYGVDASFFLVNGTTCGNHAMILSTCNEKDKIIVPRDAHKSVLAGIILSGARPVFIYPEIDDKLHLILNITPEKVEKALEDHPDAKAVLVTHPSYTGIASDIKKIEEIVHSKNKILLVDEAHGPHFHFHNMLPLSSVDAGADICVQSSHKIIGAMTQASVLHARKKRVDIEKIKDVLNLLQTTSPSYILLASLDIARMQMAIYGEKLLSKAIELAQEARKKINRIPDLYCIGPELVGMPGVHEIDLTKLTIITEKLGISGYEIAKLLDKKYNIQVEFATDNYILAIVSFGNSMHDMELLVHALKDIRNKYSKGTLFSNYYLEMPSLQTDMVMTPREAMSFPTEMVDIKNSYGKISAQIISPYPPGIPILIPGERITKEICEYLLKLIDLGARINGQNIEGEKLIKVVK
jgi:arginine/lysine/ornithine decarboxylase